MSDAIDLSIVLTGRNDDHGRDFNDRLIRTLRFNWTHLAARGVACEVVLVEWNPIRGRERLADVAARALPEIDRERFARYVVDPRYHDAYTQNPRLAYLEYLAKNAGIRRARGRFVLATNTDVFFSRGVVDTLAGGRLEAEVVYRAARIDLALGADQTRVTWEALDDPAGHARRPTLQPPLFAGGTADFLLLDRASWHRLRGFNEVYRAARVGVDHNFLIKAHGCSYRIADIGSPVYHVNHVGSFRISKTIVQGGAREAAWGDERWPSRHVVYDNPESWGLALAPERSLPEGGTWLEFDWSAVPPVADLRRVTLPLRRART